MLLHYDSGMIWVAHLRTEGNFTRSVNMDAVQNKDQQKPHFFISIQFLSHWGESDQKFPIEVFTWSIFISISPLSQLFVHVNMATVVEEFTKEWVGGRKSTRWLKTEADWDTAQTKRKGMTKRDAERWGEVRAKMRWREMCINATKKCLLLLYYIRSCDSTCSQQRAPPVVQIHLQPVNALIGEDVLKKWCLYVVRIQLVFGENGERRRRRRRRRSDPCLRYQIKW